MIRFLHIKLQKSEIKSCSPEPIASIRGGDGGGREMGVDI